MEEKNNKLAGVAETGLEVVGEVISEAINSDAVASVGDAVAGAAEGIAAAIGDVVAGIFDGL